MPHNPDPLSLSAALSLMEGLHLVHDPRQRHRLRDACRQFLDAWAWWLQSQFGLPEHQDEEDLWASWWTSDWGEQHAVLVRDLRLAYRLALTPPMWPLDLLLVEAAPMLRRLIEALRLELEEVLDRNPLRLCAESWGQLDFRDAPGAPSTATEGTLAAVEALRVALQGVNGKPVAANLSETPSTQSSMNQALPRPAYVKLTHESPVVPAPEIPAPVAAPKPAPVAPTISRQHHEALEVALSRILRERESSMSPYDLRVVLLQLDIGDTLPEEEESAAQTLREVMGASAVLLRTERDKWRHVSALGVSEKALESLVTWCLDVLEGQTAPMNLRSLWRELDQAGRLRVGLTAWLMRDAIARSCDAVTFRNEQLLAHVESFEDGGMTLFDRLEEMLRQAGGPLSLGELRARLPSGIHYHTRAMVGLMMGASWCVRLAHGEFCHVDALGLDAAQRDALVERALKLIPEDKALPTEALVIDLRAETPTLPLLGEDDAAARLWGLMLEDTRVQCGAGVRVALSRSEGGINLVVESLLEALDSQEVMTAPQLRQAITRRYGYRGLHAFREAMARAQELTLIEKVGESGFMRSS